MIETSVLIVGGGPIGLALAIDLAWRGVDCTLLEAGDGSVDHPRLGVIHMRTMELCRRWGIVDRIYNCGFNKDYNLDVVYCTSMAGYELSRDPYPSANATVLDPQSPEKRVRCPQLWFNPILEKAALEYKEVGIRHFHRFDRFEQDAQGVTAYATDTRSGESVTIRAKYMVGCDGAASEVRQQMGIPMDGNPALSYSVNIFVKSPDLIKRHKLGEGERYLFVGKQGTWANLTVVDGKDLWRITFVGDETKLDLATFDADAVVRACLGSDAIPYEIISIKPWRRTELIARRFRDGRVFLAGDAAHTMSPTGGFGMTTGLGDSADLGWKLAAVLQGWGGAALLDAYETERKPVAARAARESAKNFRSWISASDCEAILDDTPEGEATRRKIGEHMRSVCHEEWDCMGVVLGYRYDPSPICVGDGTPPPVDSPSTYVQTSRAGHRAPHVWLQDGRSTLDLFGKTYVLMRLGKDAPDTTAISAAAQASGIPLTVLDIDDPQVITAYEKKLVLVRPDGHSAWRSDTLPSDAASLMATVAGHGTTVNAEQAANEKVLGDSAMKIDVHAHIVDRDYLEALTRQMGLSVTHNEQTGQTFLKKGKSTVAWYREEFFDIHARVAKMDKEGVDMRIISLSAPSVYEWPGEEEIYWARRTNDAIAHMRDQFPDRFRGLAVLPMRSTKAALAELERAIDGLGLSGIAMGSNIDGAPLNHPEFEALWAEIDRRRLPVVEHPMQPLGTDHMDEFELPIRVGFIYDTTTALARMIYAGIFERYPNFPFVIAHTGGSLLTLLERLDNGYRIFPACREKISRLPSDFAKQLYYDTCSFYGPAIMSAREIVGTERLLWGGDDPYIGADTSHVDKLDIPQHEKDLILGENAVRMFGIQ